MSSTRSVLVMLIGVTLANNVSLPQSYEAGVKLSEL